MIARFWVCYGQRKKSVMNVFGPRILVYCTIIFSILSTIYFTWTFVFRQPFWVIPSMQFFHLPFRGRPDAGRSVLDLFVIAVLSLLVVGPCPTMVCVCWKNADCQSNSICTDWWFPEPLMNIMYYNRKLDYYLLLITLFITFSYKQGARWMERSGLFEVVCVARYLAHRHNTVETRVRGSGSVCWIYAKAI